MIVVRWCRKAGRKSCHVSYVLGRRYTQGPWSGWNSAGECVRKRGRRPTKEDSSSRDLVLIEGELKADK